MRGRNPASHGREKYSAGVNVLRILVPAAYAALLLVGLFSAGGALGIVAIAAMVGFIGWLGWRVHAALQQREEGDAAGIGGIGGVELGLLSLLVAATVFQLIPRAGAVWLLAHTLLLVLLAAVVRLPESLLLPVCAVLLGFYGRVKGVGEWPLVFANLELITLAGGAVFALERRRGDRLRRRMERIRVEGGAARPGSEASGEIQRADQALHDFLRDLKEDSGAHSAVLAARSAQGNLFIKEIVTDAASLNESAGVNLDGHLFHWVVANRKPLRVGRLSDPDQALGYYGGRSPARSFVGVPLLAGGRVEGVLALDSISPDAFPDERIATLKMATHQASMMLTHLKEIEQLRRQARDFRNLHEVGRQAGAAARVEEIISLSLHVTEERLQPEFSAVVLTAGDGDLVVAGVGQADWEKVKGARFAASAGLAGWVLESGSYLACDAQNPPPARPIFAEGLEVPRFERLLLMPLQAGSSAFGVFVAAGSALAIDAAAVDFSQAMSQQVTFGLMHLKARERLRALSGIDERTGLRTRAAFLERLDEEMERIRRYPGPLSLLMVEIDELARLGGLSGGEGTAGIAGETGAILRENVRCTDLASVWGEGRFVILLTGTASPGALAQGERLRQIVAGAPVVQEGRRIVVTVSVGVATVEGGEPSSEAFLQRAERRCEDARLKGGNRVCGPASAGET